MLFSCLYFVCYVLMWLSVHVWVCVCVTLAPVDRLPNTIQARDYTPGRRLSHFEFCFCFSGLLIIHQGIAWDATSITVGWGTRPRVVNTAL